MSEIVKKLGLLVVLVGLGLLAYQMANAGNAAPEAEPDRSQTAKHLLFWGAGLYLAGFVLGLFTRTTERLSKSKCTVCGMPVQKGHIYCARHQQEVIEKYRDRLETRTPARRSGLSKTG